MLIVRMSQINPFAGSIAQSGQVQRLQAAERDLAVRRAQARLRNSALGADEDPEVDKQVENSDRPPPVAGEAPRRQPERRDPRHDPDEPGIDLTA